MKTLFQVFAIIIGGLCFGIGMFRLMFNIDNSIAPFVFGLIAMGISIAHYEASKPIRKNEDDC